MCLPENGRFAILLAFKSAEKGGEIRFPATVAYQRLCSRRAADKRACDAVNVTPTRFLLVSCIWEKSKCSERNG